MNWIKNTLAFAVSCFVTLLLIEALLRFFPVMDVSRVKPLSETDRAFTVSALNDSTLAHSSQWDFKNALDRQTNNYGFFSDYDYEPGFNGLVVIGDSFVEARQVAFDKTFHQLMATQTGQAVYNVGLSGAPLSQYQAYAADVCREFSPAAMVFTIIANDFEESFHQHRARDGFYHYRNNGELLPTPYRISTARKLANRSSLIRYLYFHLGLGAILAGGAADASATTSDLNLYKLATDQFIQNLLGLCLSPERITFVLDANRYETPENTIYTDKPQRLEKMQYFKQVAKNAGFNIVDMQDPMIYAHEETGDTFEYSFDYHWNELGHQLVAKALLKSLPLVSSSGNDIEN